jgi:N-acetylmuramoyl-L-alanine amidase
MRIRKIGLLFVNLLILGNSLHANNSKSDVQVIKNDAGTETIDPVTYNSVGQNFRQRFIILHYTALDDEYSIKVLTEQEVSAHFLITTRDEEPIYNLVPEDKRAWHAGESEWKSSKNLNDSSIGIEIVNLGLNEDILPDTDTGVERALKNQYRQAPYTEEQIKKIAILVKYLSEKYEIAPENILGHSDVAPQRKLDPGPMFPWKELYDKYNIGMWYDENVKNKIQAEIAAEFDTLTVTAYQNEFKKFGYTIQITGVYDKQTGNVIKAFQLHFRQENFNGALDIETYSILKALNKKYIK